MTLKEKLNDDLKTAMKQKNKIKLSVIRLLKAGARNEEIDKGRELNDDEVIKLIQREIKRRKEAIGEYRKAKRQDLAQNEEMEMAILYEYLPAQADDDEIRKVVRGILDQIPEGTKINMGMVMPKALEKLKGRADGKRISKIVQEEMQPA